MRLSNLSESVNLIDKRSFEAIFKSWHPQVHEAWHFVIFALVFVLCVDIIVKLHRRDK